MRFAAIHDRGSIFYTFNGLDWVESGQTMVPQGGYSQMHIGGIKILAMSHPNLETRHIVTCEGNNVLGELTIKLPRSYGYSKYIPVGDDIYQIYSRVTLSGQYQISCGKGIRFVDMDLLFGSITQSTYQDGYIYTSGFSDQIVCTDIPIRAIKTSGDGRAQYIGMYNDNMWSLSKRRLWCRDLRVPEPFSTPAWRPGPGYRVCNVPCIMSGGMIAVGYLEDNLCFIDIRCPYVHYEVCYPRPTVGECRDSVLLRD